MSAAGVAPEQLSFASADVEVVVLPAVGARLHRLRALGHDVLRTPNRPEHHLADPFFWGAYHMAPWCNRLAAGPVRVGGQLVDLRPNFADGTAIHGQVYARPWHYIDGWFSLRAGGDGWPWPYDVSTRIRVDGRTVTIEQRLTNLADDPMPGGLGLHLWFVRPAELALRGDLVFRSNADSPARPAGVDGEHDLRRRRPIPIGLDATWTRLADPPLEMWWPEGALHATLRCAPSTSHVTAASPGHVDAIAVEPQTHAPQGLRRLLQDQPGAMASIRPGSALDHRIELSFDRLAPADRAQPPEG